jgi:hypothetical protein
MKIAVALSLGLTISIGFAFHSVAEKTDTAVTFDKPEFNESVRAKKPEVAKPNGKALSPTPQKINTFPMDDT